MKRQFARSRAPRSTVPTSPRPVGKATVKGWYFVPVVAALVALFALSCLLGWKVDDASLAVWW